MAYAREQDLKCSQEQQLYSFFYTFEMKNGMYMGERKQGRDWLTKQLARLCTFEGGYLFQRCVNLASFWMHRNNRQGLLKAKINLLLKSYMPGAKLPIMPYQGRDL